MKQYRSLARTLMVCMVLLTCSLSAGEIEQSVILQAATRWLAANDALWPSERPAVTGAVQRLTAKDGEPLPLWEVSLAPTGYLVMSADDTLPPVIAFSDKGTLSKDGAAMTSLLARQGTIFQERLLQGQTRGEASAKNQARWQTLLEATRGSSVSPSQIITAPLLKTEWHQEAPFNGLCPSSPDIYSSRAVTGCVAIAVSQVMKFHEWPPTGVGTKQHTDDAGPIKATIFSDFSFPYRWKEIADEYNTNTVSPATMPLARLMLDIGALNGADYELDSTSATPSYLNLYLQQNFRYSSDVQQGDIREHFVGETTQEELYGRIRADLAAGRPAIVSIPGHALVADGLGVFNDLEYYHFNYGWGGLDDGWYLLDEESATITTATTNILPAPVAVFKPLSVVQASSFTIAWDFPKTLTPEQFRLDITRGTCEPIPPILLDGKKRSCSLTAQTGQCTYTVAAKVNGEWQAASDPVTITITDNPVAMPVLTLPGELSSIGGAVVNATLISTTPLTSLEVVAGRPDLLADISCLPEDTESRTRYSLQLTTAEQASGNTLLYVTATDSGGNVVKDTIFLRVMPDEELFWHTSLDEARAAATDGKHILMVAGRDTCANTNNFRFTVCETPDIKANLLANYVLWYCNVDNSNEWGKYTNHEGGVLPFIAVIHAERDMSLRIHISTNGFLTGDAARDFLNTSSLPEPLTWCTSLAEARDAAEEEGKKYILMVAGPSTEGYTCLFRDNVCETPEIKANLLENYVLWYCDTSGSSDHWQYHNYEGGYYPFLAVIKVEEDASLRYNCGYLSDDAAVEFLTLPEEPEPLSDGTFLYELTDEGTATIIGIDASAAGLTELNIPATLADCPITAVAFSDFNEEDWELCADVTRISLPASVTDVGYDLFTAAFADCLALEQIEVAEGNPQFASADGVLYSADFTTLFRYPVAKSDETFVFPDTVTAVADGAFLDCAFLETVTLSSGLANLSESESIFEGCISLTTATIPDGVDAIGCAMFADCSALRTLNIGTDVQEIGDYAFDGCDALLGVSTDNEYVASWFLENMPNVFVDFSLNGLCYIFHEGKATVVDTDSKDYESVVIPATVLNLPVTRIGADAFMYCTSLTSVSIPGSVTSIGDRAFAWCSSLASVSIPNSVEFIEGKAFEGCESLTSITIPDSVTAISSEMFADCYSLASVTIPDSVTSIDPEAFRWCYSLTSVTLPKNLQYISSRAFGWCESLTSVTIPGNVTFLGAEVFYGCRNLAAIEVAPENSAFCSVDGVVFTKDMTALVAYPNGKASLHYEIPQGVVTIQEGAFGDSAYLASVTLPNSATTIGKRAFAYCGNLILASIGNVEVIGEDAFANCDTLICVKTGNDVARAWFAENYPAVQIIGLEEAASVANVDDVLYLLYDGQALVAGLASGEEKLAVTIAAEVESYPVTAIKENAFKHGYNLASVTIPDSVTSIEDDTFEGCIRLETVYTDSEYVAEWFAEHLPDVEVLPIHEEEDDYFLDGLYYYFAGGEATVEGTDSPEYVTIVIPDTVLDCPVTAIGYGAFGECYDLTTITIPATVTSIADLAFDECYSLTTVYTDSEYVAEWFAENLPDVTVLPVSGESDVSLDGLAYHIANGEATVIGLADETLTEVIIPSEASGYPVVAIGENAFYENTTLTSVSISDGVTSIGDEAFAYCALQQVTLPASVTSIGVRAFLNCRDLENVALPEGLITIEAYAFSGCPLQETVTIPASLTSLGGGAFGDSNVEAFAVASGNTVFSVLDGVLFKSGKTRLVAYPTTKDGELYIVPGYVKVIEANAFAHCLNLKTVELPQGLIGLASGAFYYCSSLESINIPTTVTRIDNWAFEGCAKLQELELPAGLTYLGMDVFEECTALRRINIPNGIKSIPRNLFRDCSALEEIAIGTGVNSIWTSTNSVGELFHSFTGTRLRLVRTDNAFVANWFIQYMPEALVLGTGEEPPTLPYDKTVSNIVYHIADGKATVTRVINKNLTSATILEAIDGVTVTAIGDKAFYECFNLAKVTLPAGLTSIGSYAFFNCAKLAGIALPEGLASIGDNAFARCEKLPSVSLPASLTSLGENVFSQCTELWSYVVAEGNAQFVSSDGVLYNADQSRLIAYPPARVGTSFAVPETVTDIASYAFSRCVNLVGIDLPEGLTSIGDHAFDWCSGLKSLTIPTSVVSIGTGAFAGCSALPAFTVAAGNPAFISEDGVLFNADMTELVAYPAGKEQNLYTVPESVADIAAYAFYYGFKLTSVTLPDEIRSLGECAFYLCNRLASITLPDGLPSIGDSTFFACSNLASITIPDSVTSIADNAFFNCTALTTVYTDSEYVAAWFAENLPDVEVLPIPEDDDYYLQDGLYYSFADGEATVEGPDSPEYVTIVIPDTVLDCPVTAIGYGAFGECYDLTTITIPATVTSIADLAFDECDALTTAYTDSEYVANWFSENMPDVEVVPVTAPPLPDPYDKRVDNLLFHIENGFATVSGVWDPDFTSVIVPDAVDGFPVTAIGDRAFSQCRKLSSITLPGGLTSIGIWAFYGCDALTELTIPDGVTSIGDYAFSYCENLIAINIPDGVTSIGVNTFIHCNKLLTIDLPSGLTSIGDGAFSYCEMLSSVSLPESLTTIGKQAFKQCYQLASVNLPDGVTSIGDDAFVSCTTLTTIELPASVNTIGEGAFSNCENLTGIHVAQSNSDFVDVDGVLYNSAITRLLAYPTRKDGDVFTVPETVTSIDAQAFSRCSRLHNITLPEGLTEIGAMAFSLCEGLTVINIPTSVDSIGESAFLVCRRLENIYVAEGNSNYTSVDGVLFNRDKTRLVAYPSGKFLQDYDIPDTVTGIDNYAFYHCFKLDKISISDTVTSIGEMAFDWCTDLVGVSIGKGVSSIPKYAFGRCSSLTEVIIYGEVNNIDQYAFEGCRALSTVYTDSEYVSFWFAEKMPAVTIKPLDEVPLPDPYDKTIDGIRYHVEDGVVTVTGVVSGFITTAEIPDAVDGFPVTAIGSHAFDDCRDLIKLTIPDSVTTIGDYAFYYCIKLPSVILPAKLTSIGEYAFSLCFKLTNVTIPAGVTSIGANAFYACDQLKTITIPAATQSIGKAAFSDCANLRSITVDEDNSYYEDLDGVLFNKEMTHLITCPVYKDGDSFVIPATVTHIDAGAFTGCHRLESITIPEGVIVLGDGAFSSCSGLRRIIIPQSVTSLGQNVFVGCQNLEAFYVAAGNPVCVSEDGVLFSADKTRLISYPAGNRALQYDIPTTVTTIESDAFFLSDSLVKVTIPDSVTSIGESAFDFCSKLTSITIPDSVTSIERYTFNRCEKLSMVTIPASVTSIGYGAFNNCPSLSTVYTDSEYVANWFAENMPSVNVIFNGGEAVEQQLELAPGWNLVTLQFPVTAESMTTLLGLRPIRFDEAGRAYVCCETPAEIVIGAGLWIFSAYAQTITLEKDQTQTSWEAAAPTTDWSLLGVSETSSWQDQATSVQQWQDGAFMDADKSLLNSGAGYWVRP